MIDTRPILERNAELKAMRAPLESELRDLARVYRPEQQDMFDGSTKTRVYDELLDATGISAREAFSNGLFGQATNPATRWFEVGIADEDRMKFGPVKRWCWAATNVMFASLAAPVGNFYPEIASSFDNVGAYGLGTMFQEEDVGRQRFIDMAIPLSETLFDLDPNGELDTFHRPFKLKGAKAKRKFPELEALGTRCNDKADYEFIHAVYPNPEYVQNRLGLAGMPYLSVYCCRDGLKDFQRVGGYREMPYNVVMWQRRPGRVWPTGPGHVALPDMLMLNAMERTHIVAAQHAAEPTILVHDESVFAPADVYPNSVVAGTVNDRGQPLAVPLNRAQNLQLSLDQSEKKREAVRDAFYFNVMQLLKRPQMTATEFLGFQEESLRQMAANLARVQSQGLSPFLMRRFALLQRAGQIPEPPEELDGVPLELRFISPLAKLQKSANARATLSWVNGVSQVAAATGDAGVMDKVDGDAAADVLHDAMGPPPSILRDEAAIEQIRKQRAQLAAQREQIAQEAQQTETAAVAAHAAQAGSLAGERRTS